MIPSIKDCVKGEVIFQYYKNKELWYKTENGFLFPVPIEDTQDATFLSRDKGIIFMRYIRKHLETITKSSTQDIVIEQDGFTAVCSKETVGALNLHGVDPTKYMKEALQYEIEHDR